MTGLDRLHLARTLQAEAQGKGSCDFTMDVPGVDAPPLQDEWQEGD
jgi:hypothetical protein